VSDTTDIRPGKSGLATRLETALVWIVGHAPRFLPFVVIGLVVAFTWGALTEIHPREVRMALRQMDSTWLSVAAAATALNIAVMGLYDVIAFRHTRSRWFERWQYGAVAFAWSNFLTLGPLAGPAIRFWLYRTKVDRATELEGGVVSVAVAFTSGLAGWTVASLVVPRAKDLFWGPVLAVLAFSFVLAAAAIGRLIVDRIERLASPVGGFRGTVELALVGWLDWLLAALAFVAAVDAAGQPVLIIETIRSFFYGQAIGLASLVPGGFGSSDAFWIAHLALQPEAGRDPRSIATAALLVYRLVYYVIPWAVASLLLLTWLTHRTPRRTELARRVIAGLVGAGGILMLLSVGSPALRPRLLLLEQLVPLPLVEVSHLAAAVTGLLLLVLARGLAKGYRAAFHTTVILLLLAAVFAILKGLDWEEAVTVTLLALVVTAQAPLFGRPSHGDWLERRDVGVAFVALVLFLVFGALGHRVSAETFDRLTRFGYAFEYERVRFIRTAGSLALAVLAAALYVLMRVPVRFRRLDEATLERALELHAEIGHDTTPMMVANGDKDVFFDDDRGFCLYRTTGPYLAVFSDPVVRRPGDRAAFLNTLFAFAGEIDRRPVFYQVSVDWIPPLHDRGYAFFKLGEEARVPLDRVTLEGHSGKMYRQILRRAERDGVRFRVLQPEQVGPLLPVLKAISDDWLQAKGVRERQFSIGFFDVRYLERFPCAIVEDQHGRIIAFANMLLGPGREELSIDLMRYLDKAPREMDFLFVSLFFWGKERGYKRCTLGMAPLASVGEQRGAHMRERAANLLFQHGETWYNFQGLRAYKEKFEPEWAPRYMAYQNAWEWPVAIAHLSALIAGNWRRILRARD
jgi:phosphatidylglycerol lysyltransferase